MGVAEGTKTPELYMPTTHFSSLISLILASWICHNKFTADYNSYEKCVETNFTTDLRALLTQENTELTY